jgi:hypothetical protein
MIAGYGRVCADHGPDSAKAADLLAEIRCVLLAEELGRELDDLADSQPWP